LNSPLIYTDFVTLIFLFPYQRPSALKSAEICGLFSLSASIGNQAKQFRIDIILL